MDSLRPFIRECSDFCLVVETGTMRGADRAHLKGDGWSTAVLAYEVNKRQGVLVTVDLYDRGSVLEEAIPPAMRQSLVHLVGDSQEQLKQYCETQMDDREMFDLALLDSHRDPKVMWGEYQVIEPYLKKGSFLAVDDHAVKGAILVPKLPALGWRPIRHDDPQVWVRK
jgi:predicted O-methyltransferase YrrM